jgi:hypothetical protein
MKNVFMQPCALEKGPYAKESSRRGVRAEEMMRRRFAEQGRGGLDLSVY